MITLHHLENSQSIRILWLLEELGVDYEFKMYDRNPETRLAPAEYKAISPLGTSPVISDGDMVLAETNAIVDYILDKHAGDSNLRPAPGAPDRTQYLFWFHSSQGSFMPLLTTNFLFNAMKDGVPFFLKPVIKGVLGRVESLFLKPRMNAFMGEVEKALGKTKWFAGEKLTAADIVMGYCMEAAEARIGFDNYPNAQRFIDQMKAEPGYQRAVEKDGKYNVFPR